MTEEEIALDIQRMRKWTRGRSRDGVQSLEDMCVGCVDISMYFHVFTDGVDPGPDHDPATDPTTDDLLTTDGIANQVQVLNTQFEGSPFTFTLVDTIRYVNASLANADERSNEELIDAIHSNRRGGKHVANVYWYEGSCLTECGEASLPYSRGIFPADSFADDDYIEVCPRCMANSLVDERDPTLTHEFGHWYVQLLFSFQ